MCQTNAIFQKSSGFLELESISSNNFINRLITGKLYQKELTWESAYLSL